MAAAAVLMQALSSRTPSALVCRVLWLTVTQPGTAAATLPLQCPGDTLGQGAVTADACLQTSTHSLAVS